MPKVVKLYKQSKGGLKYNAGPYNPITKKEVKSAGSLEQTYRNRANAGSDRAGKVMTRMAEVGYPSEMPVKEMPKTKKKPYLQRVGESLISPETKKGLKLTTER